MSRIEIAPGIELERAHEGHIWSVSRRMREADRKEVWALFRKTPEEALTYSLERSDYAITALVQGRPEVMYGVGQTDVLSGIGCPWLLGTDEIDRHRKVFLRESARWRDAMMRQYRMLQNCVDERNCASIRWLRWLGFNLSEPMAMGYERRPFRVFEMRA